MVAVDPSKVMGRRIKHIHPLPSLNQDLLISIVFKSNVETKSLNELHLSFYTKSSFQSLLQDSSFFFLYCFFVCPFVAC